MKQARHYKTKANTGARRLLAVGFALILSGLPALAGAAVPPLTNEEIFGQPHGVYMDIESRGTLLFMTCTDLYCEEVLGTEGAYNEAAPEGEAAPHEGLGLAHKDLGLADASEKGADGERGILPEKGSLTQRDEQENETNR